MSCTEQYRIFLLKKYRYCIKFPNDGMTWRKMLLSGHFYNNTMFDGVLLSLVLFFLYTYMTIKVTIIYTADPMP